MKPRTLMVAVLAGLLLSFANAQAQSPGATPDVTTESAPDAKTPAPAAKPKPARKLLPTDEGNADATWVNFRAWLLESLQRGDRRALTGIVAPNVLNALETPLGVAEFRRTWDIDGDSKDNRLLRDLSSMLQMGSAWYQPVKSARLLCVPYVPIKWPLDDVDPYDNGAIVVKEALVKDAPSHDAKTLGSLSYDIVGVRDWEVADSDKQMRQRWVKISYEGKLDGYVPVEHMRSAIEHRACFAKTGAGWRLMEYVLGIEYLGGSE